MKAVMFAKPRPSYEIPLSSTKIVNVRPRGESSKTSPHPTAVSVMTVM